MTFDEFFALTFVFVFVLFAIALVLMIAWMLGHRSGERFGRAAERANKWESIARAQSAAAVSVGIGDRDEWPKEVGEE